MSVYLHKLKEGKDKLKVVGVIVDNEENFLPHYSNYRNSTDFDSNKAGKRLVIQIFCLFLLYLFGDSENQSNS